MKHSISIKARLTLMMTLLLMLMAQFDAPSSAQEPSPTPQIELMIGLPPIYDEMREIAHAQIAKFEAETGIKVVIDDDYGGPSYWDRVDEMRGFYDVLYIPELVYLERWGGGLLPLDGLIPDEADFYPIVMDSARIDGKLYCIPKGTATTNLFYNRDSFDKAGLAYPTDDWTWDDLREASQALVDANSEPFILDAEIDMWSLFLYQAGGTLTDSETGAWAFNSPEGLEALAIFLDLYKLGRNATGASHWSGREFDENRAGMIIQASWMMSILQDNNSTVNVGVVELPSHRTEASMIYFSECYGVSANSEYPEASILLASFLTNVESQTDLFFNGTLPSRMSLAEPYMDYWVNSASEKGQVLNRDDIQTFFDSIEHGFPRQIFGVGDYEYPLEDIFLSAFEQVVNGEMTAQDMLNLMEAVVIIKEP